MIVQAFRWRGRPCVHVEPTAGDAPLLADRQPTELDWLGRQFAGMGTDKMVVNAANVMSGYLLVVPEPRGFKVLRGRALEQALEQFMAAVVAHLGTMGFGVRP